MKALSFGAMGPGDAVADQGGCAGHHQKRQGQGQTETGEVTHRQGTRLQLRIGCGFWVGLLQIRNLSEAESAGELAEALGEPGAQLIGPRPGSRCAWRREQPRAVWWYV